MLVYGLVDCKDRVLVSGLVDRKVDCVGLWAC